MSWFIRLKHKFWRKRIYNAVVRMARICLASFYSFSSYHTDATNEELYEMVLDSRGFTKAQIEDIMTGKFGEVNSLSDLVHRAIMEELPWEFDSIVQTPLKAKFDLLEDKEPKLVETYSSIYEIILSVIPDNI